jgi:Ca2+-binding RTX toxin-like protein
MAITSAQQTQLIELYVAILDRAPLASGLNFWAQVLTDSGSLVYTANEMWNSAGAQADYPAFLTTEQIVEAVFQNVFGRAPQPSGLAFWTAEWNQFGPAQTMLTMINNMNTNTSTDPQFLLDKALFLNKVEFGRYVAFESGATDPNKAKAASELITSDPASIELAKAFLNLDDAETYILTAGTDVITAGNNDDEFLATHTTLNTSDRLDGGEGDDTLDVSVNNDSFFFTAPTLNGIETITVTAGGSAVLWGEIDLSDADGYNLLEVKENEELYFEWSDIQDVINTDLRIEDTSYGYIEYDYDTNAYLSLGGGNDDIVNLELAEVDCLSIYFDDETGGSVSQVDQLNINSTNVAGVNNPSLFNYVWELEVGPYFDTLIVTGDTHLTIERALDDSVTYVDASGLTAGLDIDLYGQGAVTGVIDTLGAQFIDPITVIGSQGDDNIGVQEGGWQNSATIWGANGIYDLGAGDDTLQVGYYANNTIGGWDAGEDCHDQDENVYGKSYGNSTVTSGTGNDAIYLYLHGEQTVDTGDGNDYVEIMGDTDNLLTSISGDGESTIDTGAGNDAVYIYSDLGHYDITLGDGDDDLIMQGCEVECGEGDQTVDAGAGDDLVVISMIGDHNVDGGDGADTIEVGCDCDKEGNNTINSGAGDDLVIIKAFGIQDVTLGDGNDTLEIQGAWVEGDEFDFGDDIITSVDAGAGNDDITFYLNHFMDVDLGEGNDVLTMRAKDLTADDAINGGDGVDTVVLYNDNSDECDSFDGSVCAEDRVKVRDSETSSSQGIEVFDLRNSGIELHLTPDLFDTAENNDITVITENSAVQTMIPTLTLLNGDVVSVFSQGMTREDWDSVVEDWLDGLYLEASGTAVTFDDAESEITEYILTHPNGIDAIDFDDTNGMGAGDEIITTPGDHPENQQVVSDDEDRVFFLDYDECDQIVDVTNTPLTAVNGRNFTLLGGTIRDIVVSDEVGINGRMTLRFDSDGGDTDSVTDTLVVEGEANITAADLRNVSGLECIILESASQDAERWDVELTDRVINQTTGNADLVIWVDPEVAAGSELYIWTDDTTSSATNNVVIKGASNVTIYVDGVLATYGDSFAGGIGRIEQQLLFTTNSDNLIGTLGNDIFYSSSVEQFNNSDFADGLGNGEDRDELILAFSVFQSDESLFEQLNDAQIQDIEVLRFVLPESGNKSVGTQMTNQDVRMDRIGGDLGEDLLEVHTGTGDDYLTNMEGGIEYNLYGGDDYFEARDGEDSGVTVNAGDGNDTISGSGGDDVLNGQDGDDLLFGESGDDTINGGSGDDYIEGDSGNDVISGGDGADTIDGGDDADTIWGNDGDDSIFGGDGGDEIHAGEGDNTVYGESGSDYITAGSGDDVIYADSLAAGTIPGDDGDDTVHAGDGDNDVWTGSGDDSITSGSGDDFISSGEGSDTIISGAGDDTIDAGDSTGLADGSEYIDAGSGDDWITFDWLSQGNGTTTGDTVIGGEGSDTLSIEGGANGGSLRELDDEDFQNVSGVEVLILDARDGSDDDQELIIDNSDPEYGGFFEASGITTVISGSGDDFFDFFDVTNATDLTIYGNGGADTIIGGSADDNIFGGEGADSIYGSTGADNIDLGDDDDTDYVVYNRAEEGAQTGQNTGYDFITNFNIDDDYVEIGGALQTAINGDDDDDVAVNDSALDADDIGLAVYTNTSLTDGDLVQSNFTNLLSYLNTNLSVASDAGDNTLYLVQGTTDTALYFYQENTGDNIIDASEIKLLGVFDNALLDDTNVVFS